ncbi:dipeptidase [Dasania marina]|uniref:dipeptidase n=1 Tax=Dasania marina TaxID=471499 RepID=UPI0030DAF7BB|tara:strand:- start:124731 stop:126473 length:1743 start_codon:yes stop_codon:yes gene_type:complete
MLKKTLISLICSCLLSATVTADSTNISSSVASSIVKSFTVNNMQPPQSFGHFLQALTADEKSPQLAESIKAYKAGDLTDSQQQQLFRLLGIYSQTKYGQQAIETLRQLVAIPSFKTEGIPSHQSPAMKQIGAELEAIAGDFGLPFNNIDDRVFEITLPQQTGGKNIALHAHADVVPVNPSSWVLEDGTQLNPFKLTAINGRLYGRGAEDDKNGIVAVLYAMRVIKEEGIPLFNTLRLLVDTTEESDGTAIPYYLERHPTPDYNLALDGGYPVVIAEKGYGTLMASFTVCAVNPQQTAVISVTGGLATNQIPAKSIAQFKPATNIEAAALKQQIDSLAKSFIAEHGPDFSIDTRINNKLVEVIVNGVSAHSSKPSSGVNPVSRMLLFIAHNKAALTLGDNHISDAAQYAADNFALDYHGKLLGVDFADDFMGPLTMALTFISLDDKQLQLAVNLRAPKGKSPEQLKSEVKAKLDHWLAKTTIAMRYSHSQRKPMYRNPEGKWVNALLDIATENLNMPRRFGSSGGATSIHDLPNGVQFGLAMPDQKYTGHNANEFKRVEQFMLDLRIVTEMMVRLGSMQEL